MFRSLAGLTLELGDRLLINGEEVIFKGWVDQSQTAIEVSFAESAGTEANSEIKRIYAKSIRTLSRSLHDPDSKSVNVESAESTQGDRSDPSTSSPSEPKQNRADAKDPDPKNTDFKAADSQGSDSEDIDDEQEPSESVEPPQSQEIELPEEPEYNAWEVWTYLERQRLKTLKLLNTFQAEWEANRFVREAERNTPPNLRVHYEIRPVVLDESIINSANAENYQATEPPKAANTEAPATYTDAIDVEVIG